MTIDMKLVKKGETVTHRGLIQQGQVQVELGKRYAAELARAGWPESKTTELEAGVGQIDNDVAAKLDAQAMARFSTKSEHDAVDDAKALIRRVRNVLPLVLRDAGVAELSSRDFVAGRALKRQTPVIADYLNTIRTPLTKLDDAYKPYFNGASVVAELDRVKAALREADGQQETARAVLPDGTLQVQELKGRVLLLIEDLNRVAKNAFAGQAEIIGRFNKDLILRARRAERTTAEEAGEPELELTS